MNRQQINYGINTSKKSSKQSNPINKSNNKNNIYSKKDPNKQNYMNKISDYNNKPYLPSEYAKNKKDMNKMMRDYQNFVKKYFGNSTPIGSMSEERMNEILNENEDNYSYNPNKFYEERKENIKFEKFLKNNKDLNFGNEEIFTKLPIENEFIYSQENKLGHHKNNINDYKRRNNKLFKNTNIDNEIIKENEEEKSQIINENEEEKSPKINENEEENREIINENKEENRDIINENAEEKSPKKPDSPKKEEEEEENYEDEFEKDKNEDIKNDEKSKEANLNDQSKDKNFKASIMSSATDKTYKQEEREINAKKIQKYFREKRTREKLYVGYDKTKTIILRIYVNEYDSNKKIKSLEIFYYSLYIKKTLVLIKEIKELLHNKESISKEGIKKIMNEIIDKILVQKEESINADLLSEAQKEKNKNQSIKESKKEDDKENEKEFIIENNDDINNSNRSQNKNEGNFQNEENKSISSIDDIDYRF